MAGIAASADSIDDMTIEVHGYATQGAGFGYSGARGLNVVLATVTSVMSAPVIR